MFTKMYLRLLFYCTFLLLSANGQSYSEKYRLQVHFSVPAGWGNDPNGLIYAGGYYHMFYQHNPVSTTFGPVHWGHARSKNLIHWDNMPIAIKPDGLKQIFSGCCVLGNSKLTDIATELDVAKEDESDVLFAIYTHHDSANEVQTQAMSYSFDNGTTWTQYKGNPIIENPNITDFRDPNIFERDGVFYMTLAVHDRISFYSSVNLKDWKYLSSFGVNPDEGEKTGVWECPSLFSLVDEQGDKHDILIVSSNEVEIKGSLTQYFVGNFNGTNFTSDRQADVLWIENGFDNYAAIPYHNDPGGRVVLIGWMSNWLYGASIPTSAWRGQYTIPRELSLKNVSGILRVAQRPIDELDQIIDPLRKWSLSGSMVLEEKQTVDFTKRIPFKTGSMLEMEYELDVGCAESGNVSIRFGNNLDEFVSLTFDITKRTYEFDRRISGRVEFHKRFADRVASAERISTSDVLSGTVILDVASIEIFADDGLNTFTSLFFPTKPFENIQIMSNTENTSECRVKIESLSISALRSIWK